MKKVMKIITIISLLFITTVTTFAESIEQRAPIHSCGGELFDTTEYGNWNFAYETPCAHHAHGTDEYHKRDVIIRRTCNKCGVSNIISITQEYKFAVCHGYDW